jgi:hypothetical protein
LKTFQTINGIIQETGLLGKNHVTWGQVRSTIMLNDIKVIEADELIFFKTSIRK